MTDNPRNPLEDLRTALIFMTRLPVGMSKASLAQASWAFPVAGAVVGLIAGLVFWAAGALGLPGLAAAFLALIATAMVTGALHEDGLADAADGLFVHGTPERKLEIMRDSRTGGFGALALVLITGLKAAALSALPMDGTAILTLVAVHALARSPLAGVMAVLPPASRRGLASAAGVPGHGTALLSLGLGAAVAFGAIGYGFGLPVAVTVFTAVVLVTTALALFCCRVIGGHNGDTLGAMEQCAETTILLVLAAALGGLAA